MWEGESGWGIHVNPCLIHVNVWQKPLQYCKVISLQLIKTNKKNNVINLLKKLDKKRSLIILLLFINCLLCILFYISLYM